MSLERWGCFCFLLPFRKSPFGLSTVWLERWILSLREGWEPVLIFWWRAYSTHNRQAPSILPLIWGVGVLRTSGWSDRDWKGSYTYSQIKASSKAEEVPVACGILCLPCGPTCAVLWQAWGPDGVLRGCVVISVVFSLLLQPGSGEWVALTSDPGFQSRFQHSWYCFRTGYLAVFHMYYLLMMHTNCRFKLHSAAVCLRHL